MQLQNKPAQHDPAAYLFDMDGLLLDTERLARAAFLQVAGELGLDQAEAARFFLTLIGTSTQEGTRLTRAFLPAHLAVEDLEARWNAHYEQRLEQDVPMRPGVAEVLQQLSGQGARMAVVTSTHGARARRKLDKAGIAAHFEFVLGGDEVSANKPNPAPYLEAAARLGLQAHLCAAFEDSDRGVAAAVAAGCQTVQVPDLRPVDVALPALGQGIADTLSQAIALVGAAEGAPIR